MVAAAACEVNRQAWLSAILPLSQYRLTMTEWDDKVDDRVLHAARHGDDRSMRANRAAVPLGRGMTPYRAMHGHDTGSVHARAVAVLRLAAFMAGPSFWSATKLMASSTT